jgi:hypothetical protein
MAASVDLAARVSGSSDSISAIRLVSRQATCYSPGDLNQEADDQPWMDEDVLLDGGGCGAGVGPVAGDGRGDRV